MQNRQKSKISINGIVGILFFIFIAVMFVMITGGILRLLYSWVPLVLFAGALLVNYQTVLKYIKFLINRFKGNAVNGIGVVILTIVFYPFVAAFLLGKAFLDRKILQLDQTVAKRDEFVEYEDLTEESGRLDLKPLSETDSDNRYDQYLDEEPK